MTKRIIEYEVKEVVREPAPQSILGELVFGRNQPTIERIKVPKKVFEYED